MSSSLQNNWLKRLRMWSLSGEEYYIGYDIADCTKLAENFWGALAHEIPIYEEDWYELNDGDMFSFRPNENDPIVTKPVREWIDQYGRGFFATNNY